MADEYEEVTRTGMGSKLIGSFVGALFGIVLFLAAFPVLFINEGRAVSTAKSLAEGAANAVNVSDASKLDSSKEGNLIHLSGKADTTEELADPDFGVKAVAIRLNRAVEMYQWKEVKEEKKKKQLGGAEKKITTYKYIREWSAEPISSDSFKVKGAKYRNPPMPVQSQNWSAAVVNLGAYKISDKMRGEITGSEPIALDESIKTKFAPSVNPKWKVKDGKLVLSSNDHFAIDTEPAAKTSSSDDGDIEVEDSPVPTGGDQVGDTRITFTKVKPAEVSVLGKLTGSQLGTYMTSENRPIERLMMGTVTKDQMFDQLNKENSILTWIMRGVGFVLMAVGISLCFGPLVALGNVIPFLGDIAEVGVKIVAIGLALPFALITIAAGWVFYRPMVGIPLLVGALGVLFLIYRAGRARRQAKRGVSAPVV